MSTLVDYSPEALKRKSDADLLRSHAYWIVRRPACLRNHLDSTIYRLRDDLAEAMTADGSPMIWPAVSIRFPLFAEAYQILLPEIAYREHQNAITAAFAAQYER